jgi:hypothetical protein
MGDPFTQPRKGLPYYSQKEFDHEAADRHLVLLDTMKEMVDEQQEYERLAAARRGPEGAAAVDLPDGVLS